MEDTDCRVGNFPKPRRLIGRFPKNPVAEGGVDFGTEVRGMWMLSPGET